MPATAHVYQSGLMKCLDGTTALLTDTIKMLLAKSTYASDRDHDFISDVQEITNVSGYAGGFGGAGRKALTSKVLVVDDTNNWFYFDCADPSYGALGTGDTIGAGVTTEEITNDASSPVISYNGVTNTPTNGSAVTYQVDVGGLFRIAA